MEIYVAHSNSFDFKSELYAPLRNSELNTKHHLFLPHETDVFINTREIIRKCDVVIAEVSYPATGMGMELGWANDANKRIICIHKTGSKISSSLKVVSDTFVEYSTISEITTKLSEVISTVSVKLP